MPSSAKTEKLVLNKWTGADTPKRADFNQDNRILDEKLGGHLENEDLHVTISDKALWNAPFAAGTYFGTNAAERTIQLGFRPKAVFLMAAGYPPSAIDTTGGKTTVYSGLAVNGQGTLGLNIAGNGFTVQMNASLGNGVSCLNQSGMTYLYVAFH